VIWSVTEPLPQAPSATAPVRAVAPLAGASPASAASDPGKKVVAKVDAVVWTNPIEKEERKNAIVNPVVAAAAQSPSQTAGCSTMVTPVPHYVPKLPIDWMIGVVAVIAAILQDDGGVKRREELSTSIVQSRIDMNDYLPTSYDDMADWRTVIGSLGRAATS
jgi:hypothetical protein